MGKVYKNTMKVPGPEKKATINQTKIKTNLKENSRNHNQFSKQASEINETINEQLKTLENPDKTEKNKPKSSKIGKEERL